jgi:hypothetical protein
MYQSKTNQNQFYEQFSFRNDNFSLARFSKQLRHVLAVITESSIESIKTTERLLMESNEEATSKDDESEWTNSKLDTTYELLNE